MIVDSRVYPSRRELLQRAGALVVGALGVGVARLAAPQPASAAVKSLTLHGVDWHTSAEQESSDGLRRHGERTTLSGVLVSLDGERLGVFRGTSYYLDGSMASEAEDACMELHTFDLPGGTIAGMGLCTWGTSAFTVVGGTGDYAGVHGTYTGRQSPLEAGGDGTAEFAFTLRSGERI